MIGGIDTKKRRQIIKVALVVLWIALGVLLFVLNRGHTILLDNRNLTSPELRAPDMIKVTVDKVKPVELFRGDRDIIDVGGGTHRIRVEYSDGKEPFETRFSLPLGPDMFILSIPKMTNGIEPYFEVFTRQSQPRSNDEEDEDEEGPESNSP